jgi:hypothetical protein
MNAKVNAKLHMCMPPRHEGVWDNAAHFATLAPDGNEWSASLSVQFIAIPTEITN